MKNLNKSISNFLKSFLKDIFYLLNWVLLQLHEIQVHTDSGSHFFHRVKTAQTDVQFVGIVHDSVQVSVRTQHHVLVDVNAPAPCYHKVLIGRVHIRRSRTRHFFLAQNNSLLILRWLRRIGNCNWLYKDGFFLCDCACLFCLFCYGFFLTFVLFLKVSSMLETCIWTGKSFKGTPSTEP